MQPGIALLAAACLFCLAQATTIALDALPSNNGLLWDGTNCVADLFVCGHGTCINNGTWGYCQCDPAWTSENCKDTQCCHKLPSRILVFLLSFFVGWTGAGYFVAGLNALGAATIVLFVVGVSAACCQMAAEGIVRGAIVCTGVLCLLAASALWLTSWIAAAASSDPMGTDVVAPWA